MGIADRWGLRAWLSAPGSLSKRLAATGRRYEVQVLRQTVAPLRLQERAALGLPPRGLTVVREVLLRVDGVPLVWARSAVHGDSLKGPWKAVNGLGSRPLGHLLYDDPRIHRSELRPRRVTRHGATWLQMAAQWREATGEDPPAMMQWSRNSVFTRHGKQLRVMELFVPDVALRDPGPIRRKTRARR
ncbi:chorismate--pyruvate lyase family protein [Roseateles chitosanitabidus]|jgi:chorismate--pyruvate lyase|uniref:chorismate--pyruvate lyase family protein n=1 Tax=Roseateles chitosanitabidus TaxID=65048 RepID=UPI0008327DCC|nr:chorismate lyase [Roseateles chitosanitabidus]